MWAQIPAPNCAHMYIAPRSLRIMRAASPARLVELLRRDVFALKIRTHNARTALRAFLGGVYEVNHTAHTYVHTHTSKLGKERS